MDNQIIRLSDDRKSGFVGHYRDLAVYKKAFDVSLAVHRASLTFPKIEQYGLADQMRRASKSICANIAEGFAKQQSSKADFKRFLLMAVGSAHEMNVWCDYCEALNYVDPDTINNWKEEYVSVTKMLQALYSKA